MTAAKNLAALLLATALVAAARAETPRDFLQRFEQEAGVAGSAERGARFFAGRQGGDWSCATCHGENPLQPGRHATTGKAIQPLAPAANPERFTDAGKVEKWFRRNCNDVASRACSPREKADVIAWLLAQK
jgi:mono/diheme cytochrome c family protein